jgi:hypothetical protein
VRIQAGEASDTGVVVAGPQRRRAAKGEGSLAPRPVHRVPDEANPEGEPD